MMNGIEQIKQLENEIELKQFELKRLKNAETKAIMEGLRKEYAGKFFRVDDSKDHLVLVTDIENEKYAECMTLWVDCSTIDFEVRDPVSFNRLKTEITKDEYLERFDMEVAKIKEAINAKL